MKRVHVSNPESIHLRKSLKNGLTMMPIWLALVQPNVVRMTRGLIFFSVADRTFRVHASLIPSSRHNFSCP